jgi:hypothetical protein
MTEFDISQKINELDKLSILEKLALIQNEIISSMNLRRGRSENMSGQEVHIKLRNIPNSDKPGELAELSRELFLRSSEGVDVKMAGELADIAYYGLQPNAQPKDTLDDLYESEAIGFVGIPIKTILDFCIIKYSIRLNTDKDSDSKEKEYSGLQKYLDLHPELKELWKNPPQTPTERQTIWEHIHGENW